MYEKLVEMSESGKLIRLFVPPKLLQTHWHKLIKTNKYDYSSKN